MQIVEQPEIDRIFLRYKALRQMAEVYCENFNQSVAERFPGVKVDDLAPDQFSLYLTARSALIDIDRYKHYHLRVRPGGKSVSDEDNKLSDCVKRAAFFTKWICKLKPIVSSAPLPLSGEMINTNLGNYFILANTGFAKCAAENFLADDPSVPDGLRLSSQLSAELNYILTYREMNADGLLLFFQSVFARASGLDLVE